MSGRGVEWGDEGSINIVCVFTWVGGYVFIFVVRIIESSLEFLLL